jgi:hypothetical protein
MKEGYRRYSQPQDAQSSQERPRTRIYLMISMMWRSARFAPGGNSSSHISYRIGLLCCNSPKRKACFFIQSHLPLASLELALLYIKV